MKNIKLEASLSMPTGTREDGYVSMSEDLFEHLLYEELQRALESVADEFFKYGTSTGGYSVEYDD